MSKDKFYGLDHLRALAITLVFLFHYHMPIFGHPEWLPAIAKFGWTGVDLFFVLSGFLIASQLFAKIKEDQTIQLKEFFVKRALRIIPAYLVILAIYFYWPFFREKGPLAPAWKFLTFTQNFGLDLRTSRTFSHAWSLCVEEHFYLLFPFIMLLLLALNYFKRGFWIIIVLFVFGFFTRHYSYNNFYVPEIEKNGSWAYWYQYVYYPTYNRLDGLLVGVSIAGLYQFYPGLFSKISKWGNLLLVLSLLVLTGAYFLCQDEHSYGATVFGFPLIALGYGLMVFGALSPAGFLSKWRSKTATFIAMLSYGIYLSHKGIIHVTQELLSPLNIDENSNRMMLICVLSSVAGALLLNYAIEKPFMKMRTRFIDKA